MFLPDDLAESLRPQPVGKRGVRAGFVRRARWNFLVAEQVGHSRRQWQSQRKIASADLRVIVLRYILDASKGKI
jgi:hypothetical protein